MGNFEAYRRRWKRLAGRVDRESSRQLPEEAESLGSGGESQDTHPYHGELVRRPNRGIAGTGSGPTLGGTKSASEESVLKAVEQMNVQTAKSPGRRMGESLQTWPVLPGVVRGMHGAHMGTLGSNPWLAGSLYGLGAGAATIGALGGARWLRGEPFRWRSPRKLLAGAGVGTLAGLAAAHASKDLIRRRGIKQAFFNDSVVTNSISQRLMTDTSLTVAQRAEILKGVSQLSNPQQTNLLQLLSAVTGAGIGAAVSRFLLNAGVLGTTLGTVAGALIGSRLGKGPDPRMGQRHGGFWVNNQVDIFGNMR